MHDRGQRRWTLGFLMVGLTWAAYGVATARESEQGYRFRPESEYQAMGEKTAYERFLDDEDIPVYKGWAANILTVELRPWKRQGPGISGAYVNPDGTGGAVDNYVMQIDAGARTLPEHHLYEENTFILSGEGETHIWRQGNPDQKTVVRWRKGSMFAPPLNAWHQHINTGGEPVRLVVATDLPVILDIFRNRDFVWNHPFDFSDRFASEADYFDPENRVDYAPTTKHHSLTIVNMVRNAWTWRLFASGQGYKDVDRHLVMSRSSMSARVEQFPTGTYERAHRHNAGATIVLISGSGYTFLWPHHLGKTPWKDGHGDRVQRVEWEPGVLFDPPTQWYHQHFNSGSEPARYVRLGAPPGNEVYPVAAEGLAVEGFRVLILFREEDEYVRDLFERELAARGARIEMPSREELIRLEEAAGGGYLIDLPPGN